MIKDLIKFANELDSKGLTVEADMVDRVIRKMAQADLEVPPDCPEHNGEKCLINHYKTKEGDTFSEIMLSKGIAQGTPLYNYNVGKNFQGRSPDSLGVGEELVLFVPESHAVNANDDFSPDTYFLGNK